MDDDPRFAEWFGPWKEARPDMSPVGWYTLADLMAAFNAGRAVMLARLADFVTKPE